MSSSDKTRQKLMDSMRKTKVGAAKQEDSTDNTATATSDTQSKPAASKKAPARKTAATTPKKPAAKSTADNYQSGRRIWPD